MAAGQPRRKDEPRRRQNRRAYALIVVLVVIVLLIAGGALLMQELVVRANLLRQETNELHLQSLLDSAVAEMMAKYREDPDFAGTAELEIGEAKASMAAEIAGITLRKVQIEANYHGLRRRVEVSILAASDQPIRLVDWQPLLASEAP